MAFASNGRSHAILEAGTLRLYDNHSLHVLQETALVVEHTWNVTLKLSHDGSTLWWTEGDAPLTMRRLRAGRAELPERRSAAIVDGVVTLADLALPVGDAEAALTADGKVILGWSTHYVRS